MHGELSKLICQFDQLPIAVTLVCLPMCASPAQAAPAHPQTTAMKMSEPAHKVALPAAHPL